MLFQKQYLLKDKRKYRIICSYATKQFSTLSIYSILLPKFWRTKKLFCYSAFILNFSFIIMILYFKRIYSIMFALLVIFNNEKMSQFSFCLKKEKRLTMQFFAKFLHEFIHNFFVLLATFYLIPFVFSSHQILSLRLSFSNLKL